MGFLAQIMLGSVGCRRPTPIEMGAPTTPPSTWGKGSRTTNPQGGHHIAYYVLLSLPLSPSPSPSPLPPPPPLTTRVSAPQVGGAHPPRWALTAPCVATTDGSCPTPWLTAGGRLAGFWASDETRSLSEMGGMATAFKLLHCQHTEYLSSIGMGMHP
ncbi:hypothetical protein LZ30DRAFT_716811 [Colletotrichum cereale]|nr:hypothetical protein LZ30DRAFT_716811 [Colletotrichum cereale]